MADLFGPAVARTTDPQTSHDAAEAVTPATPTIRKQVWDFAQGRGPEGFIDEDLVLKWPDAPESSYRKRRCELTESNYILDSGRTRRNRAGMDCIVWVARVFVPNAPPTTKLEARPTVDQAEARRLVRDLMEGATIATGYGLVGVAQNMRDAAQMLRALTH